MPRETEARVHTEEVRLTLRRNFVVNLFWYIIWEETLDLSAHCFADFVDDEVWVESGPATSSAPPIRDEFHPETDEVRL